MIIQHSILHDEFNTGLIADLDDTLEQQFTLRVDHCHSKLVVLKHQRKYDWWLTISLHRWSLIEFCSKLLATGSYNIFLSLAVKILLDLSVQRWDNMVLQEVLDDFHAITVPKVSVGILCA
jgi:hypothetical protein